MVSLLNQACADSKRIKIALTRTNYMKFIPFIILLTLGFTSHAWAADQPKLSDFIERPPAMEPIPDMQGAWHWNKPGVDFKSYDKALLTDILIFIAPDSEFKGIDADQMKILSDSMRAVMIEALEPDTPVVSKAGPGVILLRIAITNVHLGKPKHRVGQYLPIGLAVSGIKKLAGKSKNLSLKDASVEAEMFDPQTGERLAVRIDTNPLRSATGDESEEMSWETIEESLNVYGNRFRDRAALFR
jgi:hypothetical protein